ncbi:MAG: hypothetical protein ABSG61_13025 [Gemmatimonadales bacterium]|jgi:hypothetical protein
MKSSRLVALAAAALLGACYEFTGPESEPAPNHLTGTFAWVRAGAPGPVPSDTVSINAARGVITGIGHAYWWTPAGTTVMSFSVSGTYSDTTQSFEMTLVYPDGSAATYVGKAWGWDSLSGTWTDETYTVPVPYHLVIERTPVPPCASPAKALEGSHSALVQFHDGVDAVSESELLADRYGFVVSFVYQPPGFNGFSALMSAGVAGMLRCEASVASIEHASSSVIR